MSQHRSLRRIHARYSHCNDRNRCVRVPYHQEPQLHVQSRQVTNRTTQRSTAGNGQRLLMGHAHTDRITRDSILMSFPVVSCLSCVSSVVGCWLLFAVVVVCCVVCCCLCCCLYMSCVCPAPVTTFSSDPGVYRLYSQNGARSVHPFFSTGQVVLDAGNGILSEYGFSATPCLAPNGVNNNTPGVLAQCVSLRSNAPGYTDWYLRLDTNALMIAPRPASTDASYTQFAIDVSFKLSAPTNGGVAIEQLVSSTAPNERAWKQPPTDNMPITWYPISTPDGKPDVSQLFQIRRTRCSGADGPIAAAAPASSFRLSHFLPLVLLSTLLFL